MLLSNITDEAIIEVEVATSCDVGGCIQIFIKTEDGQTLRRGAHTNDRVFEFMKKVADQLEIDTETMDIQLLFNGLVCSVG